MLGKLWVWIDCDAQRSADLKIVDGVLPGTAACVALRLWAIFVVLVASHCCPVLGAQGPDVPSVLPDAPGVIAPLKRYSLNLGMDSKYSLSTSVLEFTPRVGVAMRLGERETVGLSYSRPIPANVSATQSNSVIFWTSFRVMSWGKIPRAR